MCSNVVMQSNITWRKIFIGEKNFNTSSTELVKKCAETSNEHFHWGCWKYSNDVILDIVTNSTVKVLKRFNLDLHILNVG